jgi:hypothetical protein
MMGTKQGNSRNSESAGAPVGDSADSVERPGWVARFWNAPRAWRMVGLGSLVFALLGVGAGGEAAATALSTTQIGFMGSTGTYTAHVDSSGNLHVAGSVGITNQPAAPTTAVVMFNDSGNVPATSSYVPVSQTDLHQYGSVTIYFNAFSSSVQECSAYSSDPSPSEYSVGYRNTSANAGVEIFTWTFDPAPPDLQVSCYNTGGAMSYHIMVTGRTG